MGGVARAVGSIFGFGGRRPRMPTYSGPSPEEAAAKAREEAAKQAREVAAANQKNMEAMNKKLEAVRNQRTDYSQGTLGGQKSGLSRSGQQAKAKRAVSARRTQVKLDPGGGQSGAGQVQV
jgi:hypothetical protein